MALEYTLEMAKAVDCQRALRLIAELTEIPPVTQASTSKEPWINAGEGLWFKLSGPRDDPYYVDGYGFHPNFIVRFKGSYAKRPDYGASHRQMMKIVFALLEVIKGDAVLEEDEAPSTVLQRLGGVLTINRYWFDEFREYGIEPPAGLAYRVAELPKL